jgi:hypothetical protein
LREVLATSLAVNALVDQIHSAAVDILGGTGMDRVGRRGAEGDGREDGVRARLVA